MKLYLTDNGDPSVGIFPATYEITCPFERSDVDEETMDDFKREITSIYNEYGDARMKAEYDFEYFSNTN